MNREFFLEKRVYKPAKKPTIYFIGVSTSESAIMKVFHEWAYYLKLEDCQIKGIDFFQHDKPELYREAVDFISNDPQSLGALVTTHKIDLLKACKDMFDELCPYAKLLGEISCISKRKGKLFGHAKDPLTSGLAMENFLPDNYWEKTGAELFLIGAGGSSIALTSYLISKERGKNNPSTIIVSNRSKPRLEEIQCIHGKLDVDIPLEYILAPTPEENDAVINRLSPYSVVINATGLGKDAPGSPITDTVVFPKHGIAWDFNYRGNLVFLEQAKAQVKERNLHIEDGWIYFIHGWTRAIAEVFDIEIPVKGQILDGLSRIASKHRKKRMNERKLY